MKIAVLWTRLSGYFNACLKELCKIDNVQLFVAYMEATDEAPYEKEQFFWLQNTYPYEIICDKFKLFDKLRNFMPDVILVSSWHISAYRFVLKKFKGKAIRVLAMDNPWKGTPKQIAGVIFSRYYIKPLYELVFLPGERQAVFAKKLGFKEQNILHGLYCCDHNIFLTAFHKKDWSILNNINSFIFVGRFDRVKGINTLVEAYMDYRERAPEPWPLICCGVGGKSKEIEGIKGIEIKGFVQPKDLPELYAKASCLLLTSYFEPWGVTIHEATSAGLAVIATSICGATVHLVQDGYNGYIVERGNSVELAKAMTRFTKLDNNERRQMSLNSYNLSLQFTPERWAKYFYNRVQEELTIVRHLRTTDFR